MKGSGMDSRRTDAGTGPRPKAPFLLPPLEKSLCLPMCHVQARTSQRGPRTAEVAKVFEESAHML